jgi:hypothetical protein
LMGKSSLGGYWFKREKGNFSLFPNWCGYEFRQTFIIYDVLLKYKREQ